MLKLSKNQTVFAFGACLFLSACGPVDDRVEITEERVLPDGQRAPELGKGLRERMLPMADMSRAPVAPPASPGGEDMHLADFFVWETPEGWKDAPSTAMRIVNLRFGDGDVGECYLALLSGGGGGLEANVGRWYGQMGQEPPTAEELEQLPRARLLGREAVVIDLVGTFAAMGSGPQENYRMVGRILPQANMGEGSFSLFLKMTGPKDVVDANIDKYERFCETLSARDPAASKESAAPAESTN